MSYGGYGDRPYAQSASDPYAPRPIADGYHRTSLSSSRDYARDPYADPYARSPVDPYSREPRGYVSRDPYARDPSYARDPYARDPYGPRDPYAARDPYAQPDPYADPAYSARARDPYARDPYAPQDPYARDPYAQDPYAQDPYARGPGPVAARQMPRGPAGPVVGGPRGPVGVGGPQMQGPVGGSAPVGGAQPNFGQPRGVGGSRGVGGVFSDFTNAIGMGGDGQQQQQQQQQHGGQQQQGGGFFQQASNMFGGGGNMFGGGGNMFGGGGQQQGQNGQNYAIQPAGPDGTLLTNRQQDLITQRVNQKVDIFLLGESQEAAIINKCVATISNHFIPAMRSVAGEAYVNMFALLLNDNMPREQKKQQIRQILMQSMHQQLTTALNQRVDLPLLPEGLEQRILGAAVENVFEECVERSVDGLHNSQFCIGQ